MRKVILYVVIIFQIILVVSLVRGIQLSMRSRLRIVDLEQKKQQLEAEAEELKKNEEYVASPYYLEKVAREELHLAKPGETVVIIPDTRYQISDGSKKAEEKGEKANWQKWLEVLSGKIN